MVEETERVLGPLTILVNNAAAFHFTFLKNLQEEQWQQEVDINCKVSTR